MPVLCDKCKKPIKGREDLVGLVYLWVLPRKFHKSCYESFNKKPVRILYSGWPINSTVYLITLLSIIAVALVFDYLFFTYFRDIFITQLLPESLILFFFLSISLLNILIFYHILLRLYFYHYVERIC